MGECPLVTRATGTFSVTVHFTLVGRMLYGAGELLTVFDPTPPTAGYV